MSYLKPPPHSGPAFEAMMLEVDAELTAEGRPIASRPLLAARAVSIRLSVPVPFAADPSRLPPDLRPFAPLSAAIRQWYEDTYGERLKTDMTPGRSVVRLDGDLYVLKVPRVFGAVRFVRSRAFLPKASVGSPAICNIVQLAEHLTPAKAARLSESDLDIISEAFSRAMTALYTMEATAHDLIHAARGDVATAVSCLMHKDGRFGDSKWASLQAAEKTLKAAIALQGGTFTFTHRLEELEVALNAAGLKLDEPSLLQAIQCTPAIRYGQEPCARDEALAAHHASLDLVNRLTAAGAKFQRGLA